MFLFGGKNTKNISHVPCFFRKKLELQILLIFFNKDYKKVYTLNNYLFRIISPLEV